MMPFRAMRACSTQVTMSAEPGFKLGRRPFLLAAGGVGVLLMAGCSPWQVRSQSPENDLDALVSEVRLIGDLAVPTGMQPQRVEAVALVTGLDGTGGDPPPSYQRAALVAEMQTRGVRNPNQVLESQATSLVLVRGYLRPGIQKGDRFDLEVRVPSQSATTSLRNGWLMETRLKELAIVAGAVHDGHVLALGEGAILIDPGAERDASGATALRGRILGGGVSLKSRPLGLVLRPEHRSIRNSGSIGKALDTRFHTYLAGIKSGVTRPKTDEYIELTLHPRYKDNLERFIQVVRSVPIDESAVQRTERLGVLERQLLDPVSARTAALRLEAIGRDAIETLKKGLDVADPEIRFYAAESLAYLDKREACPVLAEIAQNQPAFRVFALNALGAMDDVAATDALASLLDVTSVETRYGAFRALWNLDPTHTSIRGERLNDQFSLHALDSSGPQLIHITRNYRAEVVLFGKDVRFKLPLMLEAGKHILIKGEAGGDGITVSKFSVDEPDQKRVVTTRVEDVLKAVVDLGGSYPDVVDALLQAKQSQALGCRLEIDALPEAGRTYERNWPEFDDGQGTGDNDPDAPDGETELDDVAEADEAAEDRQLKAALLGEESSPPAKKPARRPWGLFGKIGKKRAG